MPSLKSTVINSQLSIMHIAQGVQTFLMANLSYTVRCTIEKILNKILKIRGQIFSTLGGLLYIIMKVKGES